MVELDFLQETAVMVGAEIKQAMFTANVTFFQFQAGMSTPFASEQSG